MHAEGGLSGLGTSPWSTIGLRARPCAGFGIGTADQATTVGAIADGVIVGSACVRTIGESKTPVETARAFAKSFADALREGQKQ